MPSPGYRISGKEVEDCDSGSRHHQLCGCRNLQLIQNHVAPSHCPPARVLPPLSSRQSLSCCLSRMVLLFPSEPHGPPFTSEPRGPLFTSPKLPDPGPLPFPSEPRGSLYLLQSCMVYSLFTSEPRAWSTLYLLQSLMVYSLLWLPGLGLNPSTHLPLQAHF